MLFYLIKYKERPIGESGESCKSVFSLDHACNKCGTGARLIGNLRVKGLSKVKKDFFETLDGDYIISSRLYKKITDFLPSFHLSPVVDFKNNVLEFYHFHSLSILPRFESQSTGFMLEDQCRQCRRNGYFNNAKIGQIEKNEPTVIAPVKIYYTESIIKEYLKNHILNTWECLGLSNRIPYGNSIIRYARPWTIIDHNLKNIFESQGLNSIEYEEIIIER